MATNLDREQEEEEGTLTRPLNSRWKGLRDKHTDQGQTESLHVGSLVNLKRRQICDVTVML